MTGEENWNTKIEKHSDIIQVNFPDWIKIKLAHCNPENNKIWYWDINFKSKQIILRKLDRSCSTYRKNRGYLQASVYQY